MRYKVGDKVWIRDDIHIGWTDNHGNVYRISIGETDIRGKLVEIIKIDIAILNYDCCGYKAFYDSMIDHTKTAHNVEPSLQYEIY